MSYRFFVAPCSPQVIAPQVVAALVRPVTICIALLFFLHAAPVRADAGHDQPEAGRPAIAGHEHDDEGLVPMSPASMAMHQITVAVANPGTLTLSIKASGVVAPDSDRIVRIAARVIGTVAVLKKRLGDAVRKGELLAELDSREVAEARSEYFAALSNMELQKTLFAREQELWNRRVSAEQQYLRAKNTFREAELRVELAVQKLAALGLTPDAAGPAPRDGHDAVSALQRYPLHAPITGCVIERRVDRGTPVGGEGQEKELYIIADLSTVWVDLAIPEAQLTHIRKGQQVRVRAAQTPGEAGQEATGRIIFISPVLNSETRSARVIAELANPDMHWRPGGFVNARVLLGDEPVSLRVPREAVQTINGKPAVFVRDPDGFRIRNVTLGREDGVHVAITSGLKAGEQVAAGNAFLLKAELGKAEAEHVH